MAADGGAGALPLQKTVAEYNTAAPRRSSGAAAPAPAPAPLVPPAGFQLAASGLSVGLAGASTASQWRAGYLSLAGSSRAAGPGFSHVVLYSRTSALGSAAVPSLLDAASHSGAKCGTILRKSS